MSDYGHGVPQDLREILGYATGATLETVLSLVLVCYAFTSENGMEKYVGAMNPTFCPKLVHLLKKWSFP